MMVINLKLNIVIMRNLLWFYNDTILFWSHNLKDCEKYVEVSGDAKKYNL